MNNSSVVGLRGSTIIAVLCAAATLLAVGQAKAATILDFERYGVPSVVFGSATYVQDGFVVSSPYEAAVIGYANEGDPVAPTGNNGLYFNALNSSVAHIAATDGSVFQLLSLDAALLPSYPTQTFGGELLFLGLHPDFSTGIIRFRLPPSSTGRYPFTHIGDLGGILGFTGDPAFSNLMELHIFGCMYESADAVACNPFSLGQIAFDNVEIQATPVPEPASFMIFGAGILGLGLLRSSRKRRLAAGSR